MGAFAGCLVLAPAFGVDLIILAAVVAATIVACGPFAGTAVPAFFLARRGLARVAGCAVLAIFGAVRTFQGILQWRKCHGYDPTSWVASG